MNVTFNELVSSEVKRLENFCMIHDIRITSEEGDLNNRTKVIIPKFNSHLTLQTFASDNLVFVAHDNKKPFNISINTNDFISVVIV